MRVSKNLIGWSFFRILLPEIFFIYELGFTRSNLADYLLKLYKKNLEDADIIISDEIAGYEIFADPMLVRVLIFF